MNIPLLNIEIKNPFRKKIEAKKPPEELLQDVAMPTEAGRSSQSIYKTVGFGDFHKIDPLFRKDILDTLENLSICNNDFSNAVENVVKLANSKHKVYLHEGASDKLITQVNEYLNKHERKWYRGGIETLKNDLLTQLAIFGALSAEKVLRRDLKGVSRIALVNHKNIVFYYENDRYVPYQENVSVWSDNSKKPFGRIKLNPFTYKYLSLSRINENPYGIPPMLAALRENDVDDYLVDNLRYVAKKHGILGFLSVAVSPIAKMQGEDDDSYYLRSEQYLKKITPSIEQGYRNGVLLGFKNAHEIKMQSSTADGSSAKELVELVDIKKMSGLKQDPSLLGRPFNVSEAIGRVIFEKWTRQLSTYQNIVKEFLEDLYKTELVLAGFDIKNIYVEFDAPSTKDGLRAEQARQLQIMNVVSLRDNGIISQAQAAKELNYDKPFGEAPKLEPTDKSNVPKSQKQIDKGS